MKKKYFTRGDIIKCNRIGPCGTRDIGLVLKIEDSKIEMLFKTHVIIIGLEELENFWEKLK